MGILLLSNEEKGLKASLRRVPPALSIGLRFASFGLLLGASGIPPHYQIILRFRSEISLSLRLTCSPYQINFKREIYPLKINP